MHDINYLVDMQDRIIILHKKQAMEKSLIFRTENGIFSDMNRITPENALQIMREAFVRTGETPEALCRRIGWEHNKAKAIRNYLDGKTGAIGVDRYIEVMNALNREIVDLPADD